MGHDNEHPTTTHSGRIITVSRALMDLIETLRHPWSKNSDKAFLNKHGEPLNASSFRVDYWERILTALEIRKRKFYATRHTLITDMVRKGVTLKDIADYVGTSVAMIVREHRGPILTWRSSVAQRPAKNREIRSQYQEVFEKLPENPLNIGVPDGI
jgi:integrase